MTGPGSVVLVNEKDEVTGTMEKMAAHREGRLHRAFSVFIFNHRGEMLLQQRAMHKYHSGGLWTNSCCSHPLPGEDVQQAAQKRLQEEMGFTTGIKKIFDFVYRAEVDNGLVEHEFDHVFAGEYEGQVPFNREEVMDCRYVTVDNIRQWIDNKPGQFTTWFRIAFPEIEKWWQQQYAANVA